MKKQHQLIDENGNILAKSKNSRIIEAKASRANCETRVIMVMVQKNHEE